MNTKALIVCFGVNCAMIAWSVSCREKLFKEEMGKVQYDYNRYVSRDSARRAQERTELDSLRRRIRKIHLLYEPCLAPSVPVFPNERSIMYVSWMQGNILHENDSVRMHHFGDVVQACPSKGKSWECRGNDFWLVVR